MVLGTFAFDAGKQGVSEQDSLSVCQEGSDEYFFLIEFSLRQGLGNEHRLQCLTQDKEKHTLVRQRQLTHQRMPAH